MRDEVFLRMLIHARGLDICIDGLNEVSADARAAVASFAQGATKANVLISTQPIRWNRPTGARLLRLQPLRPEQRQAFLESREPNLQPGAPLRGERFTARVQAFIHEMGTTIPVLIEERVARERALSNPMDLTTTAMILANGGTPDLPNPQQTAYMQAAAQYAADNQGWNFRLPRSASTCISFDARQPVKSANLSCYAISTLPLNVMRSPITGCYSEQRSRTRTGRKRRPGASATTRSSISSSTSR
jgi:hypothetical protein